MMIFIIGVVLVLINALSIAKVVRPSYFHLKRWLEGNSEPVFNRPSVSISSIFICVSSFIILYMYLTRFENNVASIILCVISDASLSFLLILRKPSQYETNQILRNNNLNVGYGCATWYYHNYLKKIRKDFQERVNKFVTEQEVGLVPKLYILFPLSGMVKDYIDDGDFVERCRELLTFKCDYSGIHGRDYKLTVYQIIEPLSRNSVRCIIEYAQPLKTIKCFQNSAHLSETDTRKERDIFYKTLKEILKNDTDSYEHFELVQFDDNSEVHEVMYEVVRKHTKQCM